MAYIFIIFKKVPPLFTQTPIFLKKYATFPQFLTWNATFYHQSLPHTWFLQTRLGDAHMNFPIKALPKGKDSCHANRQQSTFIAFFHGRESGKRGIAQFQHSTHSLNAQLSHPASSHRTAPSWARFKDLFSLQKRSIITYADVAKCHKEKQWWHSNQPEIKPPKLRALNRAFPFSKVWGRFSFFFDSNSASMQCKPLGCRVQLHKDLNLRSWLN